MRGACCLHCSLFGVAMLLLGAPRSLAPRSFACVVLLLGTPLVAGQNNARSYTEHATRVHHHLFYGGNYEREVVPRSSRLRNYSSAGTDVHMQMRLFKQVAVDVNAATLDLKVWLRMRWVDERLAWDPALYGNVTSIVVSASNPETRRIWTPDFVISNARLPAAEMFEETDAMVTNDGTVYWSRPGVVELLCQYSGLVAFPFDELGCRVEISGWMLSAEHQGLELLDGGISIDTQEASARTSYQELSITVSGSAAEIVTYTYPCCPSAPWPVARIDFRMKRSDFYYMQFYLLPTVVVTIVSFGAFYMNPDVGERLGFGITLVLTVEIGKHLFHELLPVCGARRPC